MEFGISYGGTALVGVYRKRSRGSQRRPKRRITHACIGSETDMISFHSSSLFSPLLPRSKSSYDTIQPTLCPDIVLAVLFKFQTENATQRTLNICSPYRQSFEILQNRNAARRFFMQRLRSFRTFSPLPPRTNTPNPFLLVRYLAN